MEKKLTVKQKRERIKFILSQLSDHNRHIFMKMYSPSENKDINLVVDELPARKVNWALTQCKNAYHDILKIIKGSP